MRMSAAEACRARRLGQGSSCRPAPASWTPVRRVTRRARKPVSVAAALPPPPLPAAASSLAVSSLASLPASAPLASVVPTFPRIGGQAVRDWIGQTVENLPGFNGDDLTRLLFPDLVGLVVQDAPTFLIGLILAIAFIYWEGGILLRQLRARRQARQRQRQQGGSGEADGPAAAASGSAAAAADGLQADLGEHHDDHEHHERRRREEWTPLDRARHERRRGLGYLALTTAGLIWLCGVVNNPTPFQP
ncbi:DNA processing [Chlorella sorokiniana]|uniref:DNA processing n=1 Tax=Chlorella sorokiniana TaxID=3076 RepID=A0A2P6TZ68_CHLSO|nr:DNA processing [Chlorella sorokiniana]|eukprot:PRW59330.1 DNA processing [Chlorella sorokiniana]